MDDSIQPDGTRKKKSPSWIDKTTEPIKGTVKDGHVQSMASRLNRKQRREAARKSRREVK